MTETEEKIKNTTMAEIDEEIKAEFKRVTGNDLPAYAAEIPVCTLYGLVGHVCYGHSVGHFLTAVLTNDLVGVVNRGDKENLAALRQIVQFVYNELPSPCWGSLTAINEWRKKQFQKANAEVQAAQ